MTDLSNLLTPKLHPGHDDFLAIENLIRRYPYCTFLHILSAEYTLPMGEMVSKQKIEAAAARVISRSWLERRLDHSSAPLETDFQGFMKKSIAENQTTFSGSLVELPNKPEIRIDKNEPIEPKENVLNVNESAGVEEENENQFISRIIENQQFESSESSQVKNDYETKLTEAQPKGKKKEAKAKVEKPTFSFQLLEISEGKAQGKKKAAEPKTEKSKQLNIIDSFLEKEQKANQKRPASNNSGMFDMEDAKAHPDEIPVSENMAYIFLKQKNYIKAKEIYQKLILKFPEKSTYFATLIENIEKNIIS